MSKEDLISIVVYIGMLVIAIVIGTTVLMPAGGLSSISYINNNSGLGFVFILLCSLAGILINGIFVEVFHCLGALIGGYTILSCNIFGFCVFKAKENGQIKKKIKLFKSCDGLTGETIVAPKRDNANPMPSVLLPFLFFVLEASAFYLVLNLIDSSSKNNSGDLLLSVKFATVIIVTIGFMFALYNYVPLHIDSTTDGYRIVLFSKKINTEAYNKFLSYNASILLGEEKPDIVPFEEITDYTAQYNMLKIYELIEKGDYVEARRLLDLILENPKKISKSSFKLYSTQKIYIDILERNGVLDEEYKTQFKNIQPDIRTYIYKMTSLETYKVYLLIIGLIEGSESEVKVCKDKFQKTYKKSTSLNKDFEYNLFNKALDLLNSKK